MLLSRAVAAMSGRDFVVPGGRQGGRGRRAGPPDHAAAGDVAAPGRLGARSSASVLAEVPAPASGALPATSTPTAARRRRRAGATSAGADASGAPRRLPADRVAGSTGRRRRPTPVAWTPTRALGRAVLLDRRCWCCSRCCSAGSTWSCSPPRSPSARPGGCGERPSQRAAAGARPCRPTRSPRAAMSRSACGSATPTACRSTWWWSGCSTRRWLRLPRRRPAVRRSAPRRGRMTQVDLDRRGAAVGPPRDRSGHGVRGRLRRAADQQPGRRPRRPTCGSTR